MELKSKCASHSKHELVVQENRHSHLTERDMMAARYAVQVAPLITPSSILATFARIYRKLEVLKQYSTA